MWSDTQHPGLLRHVLLLCLRVMPRVSLAITLTGMGNYNTQESPDLECQGSNRGAGFIDRSRYIRVAIASLCSLCSLPPLPMLARLPLLFCFPGMSRPCLSAPNLQCHPRTFPGLEFYDFAPGHGRIGPQDRGCVIAHKFGQLRLSPENQAGKASWVTTCSYSQKVN